MYILHIFYYLYLNLIFYIWILFWQTFPQLARFYWSYINILYLEVYRRSLLCSDFFRNNKYLSISSMPATRYVNPVRLVPIYIQSAETGSLCVKFHSDNWKKRDRQTDRQMLFDSTDNADSVYIKHLGTYILQFRKISLKFTNCLHELISISVNFCWLFRRV